MVKTPPGNAGDVGLISGQGTKVHTATKPACCQLLSSMSHKWRVLAQQEIMHDATKIQCSQKISRCF